MTILGEGEAVVPGSNPASLTVENSEDRQSHCVYWGDIPLRPKKRQKKNTRRDHINTLRQREKKIKMKMAKNFERKEQKKEHRRIERRIYSERQKDTVHGQKYRK